MSDTMANERRPHGPVDHEMSTAHLVSLARDVGIYASSPRTDADRDAMVGAIRKQIGMKARSLAHTCRGIGEQDTKVEPDELTALEREAMARC